MSKGIGWLRRFAARFYYRHHGFGEPLDREVDLSLGHPAFSLLMRHIEGRQWADCESVFLALPADEKYVVLGSCAQQRIPPDYLDEWASHSNSYVGRLFRGTYLTYAAWRVRGSQMSVSSGAHAKFTDLLEESWKTLLAAHEAAPNEPEPLARLIPVAMGLETGTDDVHELFTRSVNTRIPHLGAAFYAVEALSAKWLGSNEDALAFAREYAEYNPSDRVVIVCAHVENWVSDQGERSSKYFDRPEVQRDIRECWGREMAGSDRMDYFRIHALNYYAFCLLLMKDDELTIEALHRLGANITSKPWVYSTDKPVLVVNTARRHLGLPAM